MPTRSPRSSAPAVAQTVVEATETALAAAYRDKKLLPADAAAVAALRVLAKKVDALADVEAGVNALGELVEGKKNPYQLDNVTVPTFLKYLDALGLTPAGRRALAVASKSPEGGGGTRGGRTKSNLQLLREEAQEAG